MIQRFILRGRHCRSADGIEIQVTGIQAGEEGTHIDGVPRFRSRIKDRAVRGPGAVDKSLHAVEQGIGRSLRRKGAAELIDIAGCSSCGDLGVILGEEADARAGRERWALCEAVGTAERHIRLLSQIPEADQPEAVLIREDEAAAVERRNIPEGLADGILCRQRDLEGRCHQGGGAGIDRDAEKGRDLADYSNVGTRPDVRG